MQFFEHRNYADLSLGATSVEREMLLPFVSCFISSSRGGSHVLMRGAADTGVGRAGEDGTTARSERRESDAGEKLTNVSTKKGKKH